jgi:hypothetical protein
MESPEFAEDEFWGSVDHATDAMLAEHKTRVVSGTQSSIPERDTAKI